MDTSPDPDARPDQSSPDAELIERARRKYGAIGAVVAGSMLGIERVLGRKPKEEEPAVWQASGEPGDIDADGITIEVDPETQVVAHPNSTRRTRRVRRRRSSD